MSQENVRLSIRGHFISFPLAIVEDEWIGLRCYTAIAVYLVRLGIIFFVLLLREKKIRFS